MGAAERMVQVDTQHAGPGRTRTVRHGSASRAEPGRSPDAAETRGGRRAFVRPIVIVIVGGLAAGAVSLGLGPTGEAFGPSRLLPRPTGAAESIDFARDIRPILSNNCYKCHGPDPSSREAELRLDIPEGLHAALDGGGTPVAPGDRDASEVWRRITTADPDDHMPPPDSGKRLTPEQIALLGRWIDAGAPWGNHWSFEPILRHTPPEVRDEGWCANDIDRFVLARLESEGLSPSPRADRATLIRRVTLDLTGLPPTPEQVGVFLADDSPDAYERLVDSLLASPGFGERWARVWLDLARYADTKGYEADRGRIIWPYRDWVIRAFNDDMPFDEFTIRQLAGDLVPSATDDDILATAFHRNTMNNDEGGTDDEEFRVAAVKDRVATTFSVWNGLTIGCAECHTHKYDPITQTEYYRVYAFFNQTADADRMDESPTRAFGSDEQRSQLGAVTDEIGALEARIAEIVDAKAAEMRGGEAQGLGSSAATEPGSPVDWYWIDDDTPPGVTLMADGAASPWRWVSADEHPAATGARSLVRSGPEFTQQYFDTAPIPIELHEGDRLVAHVWLDEADPPREIMLQIHTADNSWEHRAYWGENLIGFGSDATGARRPMGVLPVRGRWVRLEFDLDTVSLKPGDQIDGWALSQHSGAVRWDGVGLVTRHPPDESWAGSFSAWRDLVGSRDGVGLPDAINAALLAADATADQRLALERHYLRHFHRGTREATRHLVTQIDLLREQETRLAAQMVRVPVMVELPPEQRRATHLLEKGSFLSPGEEVAPGVPEALHDFPDDLPRNRLGLAEWLASPDNPLAPRVMANRFWERFFGCGIVETQEDFGAQGTPPTHPELLDALALAFIDGGWSVKSLCREIVTSSTYQQSSGAAGDRLERDPHNRLLSRGPRFRLEAEMVRDQALAVSGLLSPKMFGPPVYPPQPDGLWQVVYSGESWMTSQGEDRYRRSLYTYWRRTSPYPSMTTFDAPSREVCTPRRLRTNTPLQALVTLNDPVYIEAAQALARRMIDEGGDIASDRAAFGLSLCLVRRPSPAEIDAVLGLVADEYAHYRDHPDEALAMATEPLGALPDRLDPAEAASWTVAANVMLNLDEFLTRK